MYRDRCRSEALLTLRWVAKVLLDDVDDLLEEVEEAMASR